MNFRQLSISTRIYAGFGLLIVICMGVAGFGIDRLSHVSTQVAALSAITDNANRVREISLSLEAINRAALQYRTDADPAALKTMEASVTEVTKLLGQATAATLSEDRRQIYKTMQENIEAYQGLVDHLVAFQAQMTENRQKLFSGGDTLTAATDRLVRNADTTEIAIIDAAAKVERAVLLVRVANWRFLATNDPKGPATFKTNREAADNAISRLDQIANDAVRIAIPPVKDALAAYAQGFDALANAMIARDSLYNRDMTPRIEAMQKATSQASQSLASSFASTRQDSADTIDNATLLQETLTALTLVLGLMLALVTDRGIAKPIRAMTVTMSKLANGDTMADIPSRDGKDEIGDMARAVAVFKANLIRANTMATEQALEQGRKESRQQAIGQDIETFDRSVRGLLETLTAASTDMRATAQSMSMTADQTNQQAGAVSIAAEQASANVQTMAAATEEMASSAAEIARQVSRSTTIAARAVDAARNTDRQVHGLADTAQKIEAVVAIISDIASQTNLLALNATIEAARAGDAGKGFAVVASEVKALASQTGRATEEIGAQIKAIQSATHAAVEAIKGIGTTIDEMNAISIAIAAAMDEQGATTGEMTRSTQEAARGTQAVSSTIGDVSQGAQATGNAANQVLSAAVALGGKADTLRTEVDCFLNKIRAA